MKTCNSLVAFAVFSSILASENAEKAQHNSIDSIITISMNEYNSIVDARNLLMIKLKEISMEESISEFDISINAYGKFVFIGFYPKKEKMKDLAIYTFLYNKNGKFIKEIKDKM